MATKAELETDIDYVETARLATEAFASSEVTLSPERLRWLYERCYSEGSTVIALRSGEAKVGQLVLVRQTLMVDGSPQPAAQLVDLFVTKSVRGPGALRQLYGTAEKQLRAQGVRFVVALPNANAIRVNEHFLKLKPFQTLPLRMGVAPPVPGSRKVVAARFDSFDRPAMLSLLAGFRTPGEENGFPWDAERLFERLCDINQEYALHVCDDLLLISSPRQSRGVKHTLLCAFVPRDGQAPGAAAARALTRSACLFWRRPIFAHAGFSADRPPLPGLTLPPKWRPSPMVVQLRDLQGDGPLPRLDRFQPIDFDLA